MNWVTTGSWLCLCPFDASDSMGVGRFVPLRSFSIMSVQLIMSPFMQYSISSSHKCLTSTYSYTYRYGLIYISDLFKCVVRCAKQVSAEDLHQCVLRCISECCSPHPLPETTHHPRTLYLASAASQLTVPRWHKKQHKTRFMYSCTSEVLCAFIFECYLAKLVCLLV